jgi:hypothetical protein
MSLNAFKPRCCCANSQFYADCLRTLHVCTIFGREINVAAKGVVKDTDSFPLYDKAHKDEGKIAARDKLMTTTTDTIDHC